MLVIVYVLLAVGAIGFTLLVRERDIPPAPAENPELKHLETRRQVLLENLKDLQFEYHQGKLSDGDYQSLKAGFLYDLAGVMDSIERFQPIRAATGHPGSPRTGVERPPSSQASKRPESKADAERAAMKKLKTKPAATGKGASLMCYPNKRQWRVIWIAFPIAAFLFISGVSERESGAIAASLCVSVLGGLLVWKFSRTD